MSKTRAQIKTSVGYNTGRATEKASLIENLCDEALKVAIGEHPFRDAQDDPSAISITEDAVSIDISAISDLVHIVTARIIETGTSTQYKPLILRDRTWWDRHVVNPGDNQKGWPTHGLRWESTIKIERPADANLQLHLIVSQEQTFTDDSTECPVKILDTFIVQYVTAFVFLSIQNLQSYAYWKNIALGFKWDSGIVGGTLKHAIDTDKYDLSEEMRTEPPHLRVRGDGVSVQNLLSGHDDYGNVRRWF